MKIPLLSLLWGLSMLFQFTCSSATNDDDQMAARKLPERTDNIMDFYATQGAITDPGKYAHLYDGIFGEIAQIVKAVQGVVIGGDHATALAYTPPRKRRQHEENLRKVEDMLECIEKMDDRALIASRSRDKRLLGSCRHFAVLTCSILRHKKVPARVRGGFETHHSASLHHDHWICEYWHSTQQRWVRVDAEVDSDLKEKWRIEFDTLDLPAGAFMTGAEAWLLCRSGELNPNQFGVGGSANEWKGGWSFVSSELILDFMALNKFELLPWDTNRLSEKPVDRLSQSDLALLDKGDRSFSEIRRLYETNSSLRMPWYWRP